MREYRGHLIATDLYYLILSYCDKTEWVWYVNNGLATSNGRGYILAEVLTNDQLDSLINSAIQWNLHQTIYMDDITLEDIEKLDK